MTPEHSMETQVSAPTVTGIDVVYLYVNDLERSLRFYRDLLGIPLATRYGDPHWVDHRFASGVRFALHRAHPGAEPQPPGSILVSFSVPALEATAERLRANGVKVDGPRNEVWGSICTVLDPDGYRVQLYRARG